MSCPKCNSENLKFSRIDLGVDPYTGYHDTDELFECRDCGEHGCIDDLYQGGDLDAPCAVCHEVGCWYDCIAECDTDYREAEEMC